MRFLKAIDHALQFRPKDWPQTVAEWRREFAVMPDARPKVKPPDSAVMGATIAADEPRSAPIPPGGALASTAHGTRWARRGPRHGPKIIADGPG